LRREPRRGFGEGKGESSYLGLKNRRAKGGDENIEEFSFREKDTRRTHRTKVFPNYMVEGRIIRGSGEGLIKKTVGKLASGGDAGRERRYREPDCRILKGKEENRDVDNWTK